MAKKKVDPLQLANEASRAFTLQAEDFRKLNFEVSEEASERGARI